MSDTKSFGRRDLLAATAGGVVGVVAGFLAGRSGRPQEREGPAASAERAAPPLTGYDWTLTVQGGYGWWFRKNGNKTSVSLLALDHEKCTCTDTNECIQHPMLLIATDDRVEVTADTTYAPQKSGRILYWELKGATRFTKGMAGSGIAEGARTKWDDVKDPYGPADPNEDRLWDDQVWLPERRKIKANAGDYALAAFELTDGQLSVVPPRNDQAKGGRFTFTEGGVSRHKALTDVLRLAGRTSDVVEIETDSGKKISLKPRTSLMPLSIRHALRPKRTVLKKGDPLHHYARLFDFVKDKSCNDAVVPTYDPRTDLEGFDSPGDLCPPLLIED